MENQQNSFFESFLNEGETITYVIHKHWMALIKPLAQALLFGIIAPLFVYWLFIEATWSLLCLLWLLLGLIWVIRAYFDWFYDVLLLTSDSIIDIDWSGFFHKSSSRIDYATIEGVEYISKGILSTIFRYGNIIIQQRSGETLDLPTTAKAKELQTWILERRDEHMEEDHEVEALKRAIKSLLGDEMVKHRHSTQMQDIQSDDVDEPVEEEREITIGDLQDLEPFDEPEEVDTTEQQVIVMETRAIREHARPNKKKSPIKKKSAKKKVAKKKLSKQPKKRLKKA